MYSQQQFSITDLPLEQAILDDEFDMVEDEPEWIAEAHHEPELESEEWDEETLIFAPRRSLLITH